MQADDSNDASPPSSQTSASWSQRRGVRGKRRGFSLGAATRHSQSARVLTESYQHPFFRFFQVHPPRLLLVWLNRNCARLGRRNWHPIAWKEQWPQKSRKQLKKNCLKIFFLKKNFVQQKFEKKLFTTNFFLVQKCPAELACHGRSNQLVEGNEPALFGK